jgi:hypothetical protein
MSNVVSHPFAPLDLTPPRKVQKNSRASNRHKVHLRFRLHIQGRDAPIDCMVQELSAFGARIRLPAGMTTPDEGLVLESVNDGRRCQARVVWRKGRDLGLQLINPE